MHREATRPRQRRSLIWLLPAAIALTLAAGCLDENVAAVNLAPRPDGGLPPSGGGPTASIGAGCTSAGDCGAGELCATGAPGGYCTADCADAACPTGSSCVPAGSRKICVRTCSNAAGCRADHQCLEGLCLPKCTSDDECDSQSCDVATGTCRTAMVGGGCSKNADCGGPRAFCDTTQPGGYCSMPCGGADNVPCPAGSFCSSGGGVTVCMKGCRGPQDCPASTLCWADGDGGKVCMPKCTRNDNCRPGMRCDTASGACVAAGSPPGQYGAACTSNAQCTGVPGGRCIAENNGFAGGYCSFDCAANACPGAGVCVSFSPTAKACLAPCASNADCRAEYFCAVTSSLPGASFCYPRCTSDSQCSPDRPTCDMTSGVCVAMSSGSPTGDGTNEVVKLTPTPLTVDRTVGSRLEVTIPADAVSVELFAETISDPDAEIDFARILQSTDNFATATRLYEAGSVSSPLRHFGPFQPGGIALLFPNTPMLRFMPSANATTVKLGVQMFASAPTTANVFASIKHAPSSMLTQGTIDLNLFFVGISDLGLTAATARTDPRFQQILTRVGQLWADSGMRFGDVSYIDVPEPDASRLTRVTDDTYPEVIRQGRRGGKDWGLNMFLVNEISGGRQGFVILGRAAGIPGVPLKGNPISGVVVTTANFRSERGIEQIAQTMAHEGGHWLGLFHPSESSGTSFDLLADTPECSAAQFDRNGDRMVDRQECAGRGAENLMFWLLGGTRISPNQKFVLLRNAIVR